VGEMSDYTQMFADETDEQLDGLVEALLVLEREPDNIEELNESFRLIHTIKGSAGMLGLDSISMLTHHLESRFEALRSGQSQLDELTMNLVLRCIDFLRDCIRQLREGAQPSSSIELLEEVKSQGDKTSKLAQDEPAFSPDDSSSESESFAESSEATTGAAKPVDSTNEPSVKDTPQDCYQLTVHFEPDQPLVDLKVRLILTRLAHLGEIVKTMPDTSTLRDGAALTELKIVLDSDSSPDEILSVLELDGVNLVDLDGRESETQPVTANTEEVVAELVEASAQEAASAAQSRAQPAPEQRQVPVNPVKNRAPANAETLRVDIDRLDGLMNLAGELVVNRSRFIQVTKHLGPAFRRRNFSGRAKDLSKTLRRTVDRLQKLETMDTELARDIEEVRANLAIIEEQDSLLQQGREGFAQIDEALDQLTRISSSLQQNVLDMRMVPVEPLFNRFKRVIRDLAAAGGKKVELTIHGEKTELDKRMIDEIGDPLVHLVRNAVAHGLEAPELRLARSKPEAGTVTLEATQRGNNVFISVCDDGGGIDVAGIKERLTERKILDPVTADGLSDVQALEFIWHPGFSTAHEVTDISGRGVGMDAVKSRINELNGTIDTKSVPEEGTKFTIRLPLTLAIIGSLLVRIKNELFSVPIDDVREIVKVSAKDIVKIRDRQAIEVRKEFIPLVQITDIFDWNDISAETHPNSGSDAEDNDVIAVILQSDQQTMALQVDEPMGSHDIVIKSLSENFVPIKGLSGASILGDGTVCLMLDVGAIMDYTVVQEEAEFES
jgi:two-component system chemotaxis sensor kinase CheA